LYAAQITEETSYENGTVQMTNRDNNALKVRDLKKALYSRFCFKKKEKIIS
jgi:hypothetical protein